MPPLTWPPGGLWHQLELRCSRVEPRDPLLPSLLGGPSQCCLLWCTCGNFLTRADSSNLLLLAEQILGARTDDRATGTSGLMLTLYQRIFTESCCDFVLFHLVSSMVQLYHSSSSPDPVRFSNTTNCKTALHPVWVYTDVPRYSRVGLALFDDRVCNPPQI